MFCGRTAGECLGVMSSANFFSPVRLDTYCDETYSVYLTRKGLKFVSKDYRDAAARSCKMYGYYCEHLEGCQFRVCKACKDSEEFAMLALAEIP